MRTFLFISREVFARSMRCFTRLRKPTTSPLLTYPIRAILMVTTPIDHVISADQKSPLPLFKSSRRSSWRRQHIDRTAPGLYASLFSTVILLPFSPLTLLYCEPMKF